MQNASVTPQAKHLVLLGGGHSHLFVLKRLGMDPVPGLVVTLISSEIDTPYSGGMPSYISGFCSKDAMHIDLRPLAQFAGARLIKARVEEIDLEAKTISLPGRPPLAFDLISLNPGSTPSPQALLGAEHACAVKPIAAFLTRWEAVHQEALAAVRAGQDFAISLIGGGPASVELALAMHYRIHTDCGLKLKERSSLTMRIIGAAQELLPQHNGKVRQRVMSTLKERRIEVHSGQRVKRFLADSVQTTEGQDFKSDASFYATGAALAAWPARCGLGLAADGFLDVLPTLQTASHEFVFAAGDAASIRGAPRPKSGVYAVRAGKILAENLIRYATQRKLKTFKPQRQALALISMGDKSAIASKGSTSAQGRLVWQIKQRIDSRFVNRFSHPPAMQVEIDLARGLLDSEDESQLRSHALRCAGCGAKVASGVLDEVLDELHEDREPRRVEDASSVALPDGRVLLQSIDQLSAFINDPFLFARIASNHALSDIYAMGAQPHSALAVIGMPMASRTMSKRLLSEIMQGCKLTLAENDCELLGGHTAENPQLQLGLAVNAFAKPDECLTKDGASATDLLILTRPLGTGTLLAGDMRALSRHRWIESAVEQMLLSNRRASQIFSKQRASACTDITGFGFAGHLAEMITPNGAAIELALDKVPLLEGSLELAERGVRSSLYESNKRAASVFYNDEAFGSDARFNLLFDPQTAGGLLASIPEHRAGNCVAQLREAGYGAAAIVGRVVRTGDATASVVLK